MKNSVAFLLVLVVSALCGCTSCYKIVVSPVSPDGTPLAEIAAFLQAEGFQRKPGNLFSDAGERQKGDCWVRQRHDFSLMWGEGSVTLHLRTEPDQVIVVVEESNYEPGVLKKFVARLEKKLKETFPDARVKVRWGPNFQFSMDAANLQLLQKTTGTLFSSSEITQQPPNNG